MNRRRFVLVGALVAAGAVYAADELPSGESILERFIEVTGGKEAHAKQKSEIQTGTLEFPAQGLKAKIVRYAADPDKYLASMDIAGIGMIETGYSDGVAWENSVVMGPRIKTGEEKAMALHEATFDGAYNWRKVFSKASTEGTESVAGEDCYKVVMTPKEGRPETMYFSKKSGLLLKSTTVAVTQMGEVPVEVQYAGYKEFGGVLSATLITQKAAGQDFTVRIDGIRVNEEIPAEKFGLPDAIKALQDKK